jgi:hypothetical protein
MAGRFGLPTLGAVMAHAAHEGYQVSTGYFAMTGRDVVVMTSPDGRSMVLADADQSRRLFPRELANIERRIGLHYPY